ncbi:hypothetical protein ANAEL_00687 [Anaerolineales bacterium]|nr:hypothetical protein ANAEL_00687 [Anaerolineales bacterium]
MAISKIAVVMTQFGDELCWFLFQACLGDVKRGASPIGVKTSPILYQPNLLTFIYYWLKLCRFSVN